MYNGIGLQTARGSGTNGYVQTNKFFIKAKVLPKQDSAPSSGSTPAARKPNKELLEHDRKKQVEIRLLVLRETLEEQGYTDAEIEEKVFEARAIIEAESVVVFDSDAPTANKRFDDTQSHHNAARKEKQLETFRAAFGIKYPDNEALDKNDEERESDVESGEFLEEANDKKNDRKDFEGKDDFMDKKLREVQREQNKKAVKGKYQDEMENDYDEQKTGEKSFKYDTDENRHSNRIAQAKKTTDVSGKRSRHRDSDDSSPDVDFKRKKLVKDAEKHYDKDHRRGKHENDGNKFSDERAMQKASKSRYDLENADNNGSRSTKKEFEKERPKVGRQDRYSSSSDTDDFKDEYKNTGKQTKKKYEKERPKGGRQDRYSLSSDMDDLEDDNKNISKCTKKEYEKECRKGGRQDRYNSSSDTDSNNDSKRKFKEPERSIEVRMSGRQDGNCSYAKKSRDDTIKRKEEKIIEGRGHKSENEWRKGVRHDTDGSSSDTDSDRHSKKKFNDLQRDFQVRTSGRQDGDYLDTKNSRDDTVKHREEKRSQARGCRYETGSESNPVYSRRDDHSNKVDERESSRNYYRRDESKDDTKSSRDYYPRGESNNDAKRTRHNESRDHSQYDRHQSDDSRRRGRH